ncbi:hypothetical protein QEZ54_22540 [Catellatospora sp. KI3]|uniref:hypothetical protein n=1 Tax=Catellatospora sp. KI3 TaxID=3041620 RepID=UPI002482FD36|nr:hypothetical protein [Catellatospora sp. KI3]MDI1463767.1 hypothetical protein [Catellatospora sp. KI3]
MSLVRDEGGGGSADFTAALRAGGYGLPDPSTAGHGHSHGTNGVSSSVRTAVHNGHEIRIETTYAITIDGKPLEGGLEVLDNGAVHYHGLPQYALPSAIDLCKRVLDYFGTRPPAVDELGCLVGEHSDCCACPPGETPAPGHDHGAHDHADHDHAAGHDHAAQPTQPAHDHAGHSHEHGGAH